MAVAPKISIARILADLNLTVRYGIAICIYASRKFFFLVDFNLVVVIQTAKLPNLPAIRYNNMTMMPCPLAHHVLGQL